MEKICAPKLLCLLIVLSMLVAGCSQAQPETQVPVEQPLSQESPEQPEVVSQPEQSEVVVCTIVDLSGVLAAYGNDTKQGVEIAVDEINEAGGINGAKIVLRAFDEKTDPVEAVKIAQLVADECVATIVGSGSGPAIAAGPYLEDAGIPFIITVSSNETVTKSGWEYVSRIQLSDYDQLVRSIEYAVSELGITKAALLHDTTDFGLGGKQYMQDIIGNRDDIELVSMEGWRLEDADYSSQILNAQRSGADAIWIVGAAEGGARIVQQSAQLGVEIQFLGNNGLGNQKFLDLAGDASEGLIITWGAVDPTKQIVQDIEKKMQERYNRSADVFVAHAYDAMYILAEAMRQAGMTMEDRPAIQKAIRSGVYNFSLGELSFDETGHNIRHIFIAQVVDGEFKIIN